MKVSTIGACLAFAACFAVPGITRSGAAYAQNANATISGQVLDPAGALLPAAHIKIVNQDTGVNVFDGASDAAGTFVAPQVIPGRYRLTVVAPGLKQFVVNGLIASVAQVASINVNVQLGENSETVTLQAKG